MYILKSQIHKIKKGEGNGLHIHVEFHPLPVLLIPTLTFFIIQKLTAVHVSLNIFDHS